MKNDAAFYIIHTRCARELDVVSASVTLNGLTAHEYCSSDAANLSQSDWKKTHYRIQSQHMFVDILMKLRSVAIHLFSPEHANSSVSFWTESLKAAGIEDTLVSGGRGWVRGWRAPP